MYHIDVPLICKLQKALYGLKQASRAWFEKLKSFLQTNLHFQASVADNFLFIKHYDWCYVFLLVYVDDTIVTGSSASTISAVIQPINQEFKLKDLGNLGYFMGMEVLATDDYLVLNQKKYVQDIVNKLGLTDSSVFPTPMIGICLSRTCMINCSDSFDDVTLYRSTIEALQHICVTMLDINF